MPLDTNIKAILEMFAAAPQLDMASLSVATMRLGHDTPMQFGAPPPVADVRDVQIELADRTLPARLYVPEGAGDLPPLTLYFHGGGWVIGTLETHDGTCRGLANASRSAVLSVGYRLAPEHRYPAAVEDCYDAVCWAQANAAELGVDAGRLAVAGDSAGGNLAAAAAIMVRDRGGPALRHQLLFYPVTDANFANASYTDNGGGMYFLSTDMMRWFWDQYLGDLPVERAPLAAVLATPSLARLPSATVITAEFDPLRDEGMAYARRLSEAGVAVDAVVAPGMIHGFASMFQTVPSAANWLSHAGEGLRKALA